MTPPIELSLAGDGRTLVLTPSTVKKAYFQFTSVNREYGARQKYGLQIPLKDRQDLTILDALHRFPNIHLHAIDIHRIETELNRQLIEYNLALVDGEGELRSGYGRCQSVGKNREKVLYIIRCGMIFILQPMVKNKIFSMRNIDLFWQDRHFDFHYVRYVGLFPYYHSGRVKLLFRNRLDLSQSWTAVMEDFQPRQLFEIAAIYPCQGFLIDRLSTPS